MRISDWSSDVCSSDLWVDDGTEGFFRLKLSYEIHPDDAHYVADRRGMSAAMRSPLDGREAQSRSAVAVELSADNAWFDDDAMLETETLIVAAGVPKIGRAHV